MPDPADAAIFVITQKGMVILVGGREGEGGERRVGRRVRGGKGRGGQWKGRKGRGRREGEGKNDLTHPLSQIPGYATG